MTKIISDNPYFTDSVHKAYEEGKKAQRDSSDKEWFDWGDSICMEHGMRKKRRCDKCWQALKRKENDKDNKH